MSKQARHERRLRRARRARRAARRGAATVEAVASLPFFILILAATVFTGRLYRQKLNTYTVARGEAWDEAMNGCDAGDGPLLPPAANANLGIADNPTFPGVQLCDTGFGERVGVETGTASVSGAFDMSQDVTTRIVVTCNEVPQQGDFRGGVAWLAAYFDMEFNPDP